MSLDRPEHVGGSSDDFLHPNPSPGVSCSRDHQASVGLPACVDRRDDALGKNSLVGLCLKATLDVTIDGLRCRPTPYCSAFSGFHDILYPRGKRVAGTRTRTHGSQACQQKTTRGVSGSMSRHCAAEFAIQVHCERLAYGRFSSWVSTHRLAELSTGEASFAPKAWISLPCAEDVCLREYC